MFLSETKLALDEIRAMPTSKWQSVSSLTRDIAEDHRYLWSHTRIVNETEEETWVAANGFSWFSEVNFYIYIGDRVVHRRFTKRSMGIVPRVEFEIPKGSAADIYIEIYSPAVIMLQVQALPESIFELHETYLSLGFGVFIGFNLMFVLVVLLCFMVFRDSIFLSYLSFHILIAFAICLSDPYPIGIFGIEVPYTRQFCSIFFMILSMSSLPILTYFQSFSPFRSKKILYIIGFLIVVTSVSFLWIPLILSIALTHIMIFIFISIMVKRFFKMLNYPLVGFWALGALALAVGTILSSLCLLEIIPSSRIHSRLYIFGFVLNSIFVALGSIKSVFIMRKGKDTVAKILQGSAPETLLNEIGERSLAFVRSFTKKNVTIMFIDVVDFSLTSRKLGARGTYTKLAGWSKNVYELIERHGGKIDRSLGDGLLCFFAGDDSQEVSHATRGFRAAKEIQEHTVKQISTGNHQYAFPVRIGLHTADVGIGNLGDLERSDFTMIGDGVNFASRLETACNTFKITMSSDTRQLISNGEFDNGMISEIFIKIKHSADFVKAYEYNPFLKNHGDLKAAEDMYIENVRQVLEARKITKINNEIYLDSPFGTLLVHDFSLRGFGVESQKLIGQKTRFFVTIRSKSMKLDKLLEDKLLRSFEVEVRWSHHCQEKYFMGLLMNSLSKSQQSFIFSSLVEAHQSLKNEGC